MGRNIIVRLGAPCSTRMGFLWYCIGMATDNQVKRGVFDLQVYTIDDLAERVGLTDVSVRAEIREGKLKALKMGGPAGYRILHEDIFVWLRSKYGKVSRRPDLAIQIEQSAAE